MLFTPHLYSFRGVQGTTLEPQGDTGRREVFELYADIMFCAALNAWVLDGHGCPEDYPHTRGDFHEFMAAEPKEYGKALNFAVQAMTGKSIQDFISDASKPKENGSAEPEEGKDGKKKARFRLTGRNARRSS